VGFKCPLVEINLKCKGIIWINISQGYINGSVPPPPLPNFNPDFKRHLRVDYKKTIVLNIENEKSDRV